jgi:hypothetical protein
MSAPNEHLPYAPAAASSPGWGTWMGAALGFGLGMAFALGGFWTGLLCLLFTIAGAILGRLLAP